MHKGGSARKHELGYQFKNKSPRPAPGGLGQYQRTLDDEDAVADGGIVDSTVMMLGNGAKTNYESNGRLSAYNASVNDNFLATSGPANSASKNKFVVNKQSQLLQGVLSQQRRFSRIISSTSKNQHKFIPNFAKEKKLGIVFDEKRLGAT